MIIVKLQGGLGNQMFQYAMGRALQWRTRLDVFFEKTWYEDVPENDTVRIFELGIFSLPIKFAAHSDIPWECRNFFLRKISFLQKACGFSSWNIIVDRGQAVEREIFQIRPGHNVYLRGSWNSEKYFSDAQDVIRNDFVFCQSPDKENQAALDRIAHDYAQGIEAVSIHVRRGDYSSNPITNAHHGLLPLDYYRSAMMVIEKRFPKVSYYVFSDDLEWCRSNLLFKGNVCFVDANAGKPGWMDMRLMGRCHHHIIANSSFSWWGAWLNASKDKIVIAPQKWVSDPSLVNDDILPADWLKI